MKVERIEVGTSGWRFEDWAGVFYPYRVPKARWLEYYSARFRIGELNSSYYRLPTPATIDSLIHRTPDHFRWFVKLHAHVTHERNDPESSIHALLDLSRPLNACGKLLGYLAQFPASFKRSDGNVSYIERISREIGDSRLCVEFRDRSWDVGEIREWFSEAGLTWVNVDEPSLPNLMPPALHVTSDVLYLRLHGRNARTWYDQDAGDRYDYDYSDPELREWETRLLDFSEEVSHGYIFFNNCRMGQAVKNAERFSQWLNERLGRMDINDSKDNFTLSSP